MAMTPTNQPPAWPNQLTSETRFTTGPKPDPQLAGWTPLTQTLRDQAR
jgi:hypothetical protein